MSFEVSASAYDRFMGRYSAPLAVAFADLVDVRPGQRALGVGCAALRERCREQPPTGAIDVRAAAWVSWWTKPGSPGRDGEG